MAESEDRDDEGLFVPFESAWQDLGIRVMRTCR
jgi:hypothetical protein